MSQIELNRRGISRREYEIGRLQYIVSELNKESRQFSKPLVETYFEHYTVFFDAVVRQKRYVPEPSDVVLGVNIR